MFVNRLFLTKTDLICSYTFGGAHGVMLRVMGNGHGDMSSSPGGS